MTKIQESLMLDGTVNAPSKLCKACNTVKSLDEFGRLGKSPTGQVQYGPRCKKCKAIYTREYYWAHPERKREIARLTYYRAKAKNPDKHRLLTREKNMRFKWGLTAGKFELMLQKQGNVCAICGNGFTSNRDTNMDHNHLTGQFRGILCKACNTTLGLMRENAGRLRRAAEYLEKRRS